MDAERFELLLAKEEIRDALYRYCRGIDRMDEALVRSAYHPDSIDEHGLGPMSGYDLAALTNRESEGPSFPEEWEATQHQLTNILIAVDGEQAVSESYFNARHRFEHEGRKWDQVVIGRYIDRWERRDGEFKITHRKVVYDMIRCDVAELIWPGPDTAQPKMTWGDATAFPADGLILGRRDGADPSYELAPALHGSES